MSGAGFVGWVEFGMSAGSRTHIAYAYEDGSVYLPEGRDVVDLDDYRLASASERFWPLMRVVDHDAAVAAERDAGWNAALEALAARMQGELDVLSRPLGPRDQVTDTLMRTSREVVLNAIAALRRPEPTESGAS